ncbi:hypothetical protein ATCC90586_003613 [Pythium insidiosum]|nr:hypothetical protein ATCC90586_003613 [Pythium insidiosum]
MGKKKANRSASPPGPQRERQTLLPDGERESAPPSDPTPPLQPATVVPSKPAVSPAKAGPPSSSSSSFSPVSRVETKPLTAPTRANGPTPIAADSSAAVDKSDAKSRLQFAAWLVALSSFLWGYGVAVLNVCIVPDAVGSLLNDIYLSTHEQETATALVIVGALFAALTTGGIGQRLGLRRTILLNNALFILGGTICALAMSKRAIFLGRLCVGVACGVVTNTVPILLNEISPPDMRGRITSFHQLLLTIGMLTTGVLGFAVVANVPSGWRYLNAFIALPAVTQLMFMAWVPESPWWLMKHKGRDAARRTLLYLRNSGSSDCRDAIEAEVSSIALAMETDAAARHVEWSDLWQYKSVVAMGAIMVFFQAMTGINTVMLYSGRIFHFAGVTNPFLATAVVGVVNVLVTVVSVSLVDSFGRRPLLLYGTALMIVALLALSTSLLYLNDNLKLQGLLAVTAVLLFVAGFAVGLGAVVWVLLADITPVAIRSRAFSIFMGVSYNCNIVIAVFTLSAINALGTGDNPEKNGIAKLYLILCGVCAVSWAYTYSSVAETANPKTNAALHTEESSTLLLGEETDGQEEERVRHRGHTTEL